MQGTFPSNAISRLSPDPEIVVSRIVPCNELLRGKFLTTATGFIFERHRPRVAGGDDALTAPFDSRCAVTRKGQGSFVSGWALTTEWMVKPFLVAPLWGKFMLCFLECAGKGGPISPLCWVTRWEIALEYTEAVALVRYAGIK